jgi:hypothetical protein
MSNVYAQSDVKWETAYMVGKFLNSEPPKPDQIFKLQYGVVNGTVESFDVLQEIDDVFVQNMITARVNGSGNGVFELKFPRNFPYTNSDSSIDWFTFDVSGDNDIIDERVATDCFFEFSIPFSGDTEIEMMLASILIKSPYHGDDVPDSCIPETIVEDASTITPLDQFRAGVVAKDTACRQGYELVIHPNGKPYCATPASAEILKERWK